jgi:hypothetical protein
VINGALNLADTAGDCASGTTVVDTSCESGDNDWVYYDIPSECNPVFRYGLISTDFLEEACTGLYPANIQGFFPCDQAEFVLTVNGNQICNALTPVVVSAVTDNFEDDGVSVAFEIGATADCDANPTVVASRSSGTVFPIGNSFVSVEATDKAGNSATCSFTVSVDQPPTLKPSAAPSTSPSVSVAPSTSIMPSTLPSCSPSDKPSNTPTVSSLPSSKGKGNKKARKVKSKGRDGEGEGKMIEC